MGFKMRVIVVLVALVVGCSTIDRINLTRLEPVRSESGAQYFKYTSFADAIRPNDSVDAEKTRIEWLEKWLQDNGLNSKDYTIVYRKAVVRQRGLLGDIYDIYYEVKVPK